MERRSIDGRIEKLIQAMTLEEKASLCSGKNFYETQDIDRLGVHSMIMSDGSHGLRRQMDLVDPLGIRESMRATCYPTASTVACSFDRKLLYMMGDYIGRECRHEQVSVLLGPGVNIKRSPLCGRNYEYYSEDPYLTGELASAFVTGVQQHQVGTCLGNFVANNQEKNRMTLDTIIDERALREIYLAAFEKIVKTASPWGIMCSYNLVNGEYVGEHNHLLQDILRREWGYEGLIVSDWGAINDRLKALIAGLDLEMPSSNGRNDKRLVTAIRKKYLESDILDQTVYRVLASYMKLDRTYKEEPTYIKEEHHKIARQIACESIVLLKNEDNILPLSVQQRVGIIGAFAKYPKYQGTGCSKVNPTMLDSPYEEIVAITGRKQVSYAPGYDLETFQMNHQQLEEAIEVATVSDVVLLFVGLPPQSESESIDREHMQLPKSHNRLIAEVRRANKHIVVILNNGSPVEMPWIQRIKGIVEPYLAGQGGGYAIAQLLYGQINPSGKLAETFPKRLQDNAAYKNFGGDMSQVQYRESIFVGYRYYDRASKEVLFPFGHGLSYTTYHYHDMTLSTTSITDLEVLRVSCKVTNTGTRRGKEIIQIYVRDSQSSIFRPDKELKGFCKVQLQAGETQEVSVLLDKRSFAYYNKECGEWIVESGDFEILIGASSRDIRLQKSVYVQSTSTYNEDKNRLKELLPSYYSHDDSMKHISKAEFISLYDGHIHKINNDLFTMNSRLIDVKNSLGKYMVRIIARIYERQIRATIADTNTSKMVKNILWEMPIRGLVNISQGHFSEETGEFLVAIANRKKRLIKGLKFIRSLCIIKRMWRK